MSKRTIDHAKFRCAVSGNRFWRTARAIDYQGFRRELYGVHIQPLDGGGVLMTATDGKIAIRFYDADGWANQSGVVKLEAGTMAACKSTHTFLSVAQDRASVSVREAVLETEFQRRDSYLTMALIPDPQFTTHHQFSESTIDATFPEINRLMLPPDPTKQPGAMFNTSFLAKLSAALCVNCYGPIRLVAMTDTDAHYALGDRDDCFGIIMPLASGRVPFEPPVHCLAG